MHIEQFEDKNLSHFSYAILSECEKKVIVIDTARNIQPYLNYAKENDARITAVIETHPHADFVSGHWELHQLTGADIYTGKLVQALYPHRSFDEGQTIQAGKITLSAINTPGHSPDSISIVLTHEGKQKAVFTGDTLFIGDCGRPDLREGSGKLQVTKTTLAKQMYHSLREKLMVLPDEVLVYPAHGAGTLCGKKLSKEHSSTIGKEKQSNWSLQEATEAEFIQNLLEDQPFIPGYFPFNVELNRKGVAGLQESLQKIKIENNSNARLAPFSETDVWIIDTRNEKVYKEAHFPHSINLMENGKFETWLGSIIHPEEKIYLAGESREQLQRMLERAAVIGYETQILEAVIIESGNVTEEKLNVAEFKKNTEEYTIVDVRNASEVAEHTIFPHSLAIPLAELRDRAHEVPVNKPIVVHCAGGYRSAAGSSLLQSILNKQVQVFDMGEPIKQFYKPAE